MKKKPIVKKAAHVDKNSHNVKIKIGRASEQELINEYSIKPSLISLELIGKELLKIDNDLAHLNKFKRKKNNVYAGLHRAQRAILNKQSIALIKYLNTRAKFK